MAKVFNHLCSSACAGVMPIVIALFLITHFFRIFIYTFFLDVLIYFRWISPTGFCSPFRMAISSSNLSNLSFSSLRKSVKSVRAARSILISSFASMD